VYCQSCETVLWVHGRVLRNRLLPDASSTKNIGLLPFIQVDQISSFTNLQNVLKARLSMYHNTGPSVIVMYISVSEDFELMVPCATDLFTMPSRYAGTVCNM
jgi:hypothetical protein